MSRRAPVTHIRGRDAVDAFLCTRARDARRIALVDKAGKVTGYTTFGELRKAVLAIVAGEPTERAA